MIHVHIKRSAGQFSQVKVNGHAGKAPHGEDIVCAGVSTLVQTYFFSLQRLLQLDVTVDVRDGYFNMRIPCGLSPAIQEKVNLLGDNMLIGLDEINRGYPGVLEVQEG